MLSRSAAGAILVGALLASASADTTRLHDASLAWERGDYVAALTAYLELLDGPTADSSLEAIALQTGELFQTVELTSDGAAPQFSPDGRHVTYETGEGLARRTRLLRADGSTAAVAELPGGSAAFSPDGTALAYLRLDSPSPAVLESARLYEGASGNERQQRFAALTRLIAVESRIALRSIATADETLLDATGLMKTDLRLAAGRAVLVSGADTTGTQIYLVRQGDAPRALTSGAGFRTLGSLNADGTAALFTIRSAPGGRGRGADAAGSFGVITLPDGKVTIVHGTAPAFSADGSSLAYVVRGGDGSSLMVAPAADPGAAVPVRTGPERIDAPVFSPDGSRVAFQMMPREDWELYLVNRDGTGETRLTREIQHDLMPRFLSADRLLAVMGEARHRRSYLYDLTTGRRQRLFHNNTVRTIAPEYAWVPSPAGTDVLIVAERDGDTVSPERGVYLMDLTRQVSRTALRERVAASLAAEQALRDRGRRMYEPIAAAVRAVVDQASVDRVYGYGARLFAFDSKHISQPGNAPAGEYLYEAYRSFGYEPEYQPFDTRGALGGRTANVIATLKGTVHPELVYVVGSHYDSVTAGPGADDNSSGTAALLETARILAGRPQAATIVFASFTGEEAGLLGSREFVRRGRAAGMKLLGVLNNDMVGYANDQRLDNTIRYSNPGIRDVQHAAAMQFSQLITYDALYYKSTDAAAFYEAYGDIVGGIGSYPVLGNPHYHQSHDVLETIDHRLVTEVARTTAATLMLLASSPSRVTGLQVKAGPGDTAAVTWEPSPEKDVTGYVVVYGPPERPDARQMRVTGPSVSLKDAPLGTVFAVKAVNDRELEGWDWARTIVR